MRSIYRADITVDVIELAILGVLKESELHGYELKKRLREVLGPLSSVSFGSLYPALARLEAAGAVKAVEAADVTSMPAIPMTGSLTGEAAAFRPLAARRPRARGKKVYGITDAGDAACASCIADPTDDDRAFNLKLAFCRYLRSADAPRPAAAPTRRRCRWNSSPTAQARQGGRPLPALPRGARHRVDRARHRLARRLIAS